MAAAAAAAVAGRESAGWAGPVDWACDEAVRVSRPRDGGGRLGSARVAGQYDPRTVPGGFRGGSKGDLTLEHGFAEVVERGVVWLCGG